MTAHFTLQHRDGRARTGMLATAHGIIETPTFMPVGTRGTVKALWQEELSELGAQVLLANTYHLYLRPGHELIEQVAGGLHGFINWPHPILTDSGGYQVFSLNALNRTTREGVVFRSHLDGSRHLITPETSMAIQKALGSDLVMMFDHCPKLPSPRELIRESMELTLHWAQRCAEFPLREEQQLFAIIQGGLQLDLRRECLERLLPLEPAGFALGGLSVGEKNQDMRHLLEQFTPELPAARPRYLMGVGTPLDILHAVAQGVDLFDCVLPTRNGRNGQALTSQGSLQIKNERFKEDPGPLDPRCPCKVCTRYSRAYLRHLAHVGEYLAGQMLSYHNLFFYLHLLSQARQAIAQQTFDEFAQNFYNQYLDCPRDSTDDNG